MNDEFKKRLYVFYGGRVLRGYHGLPGTPTLPDIQENGGGGGGGEVIPPNPVLLEAWNQISPSLSEDLPQHFSGQGDYVTGSRTYNEVDFISNLSATAIYNLYDMYNDLTESILLYVINPDGVTDLKGNVHPYGDSFSCTRYTVFNSDLEMLIKSYECPDLWDGILPMNESDLEKTYGVSEINPLAIYIGETTELPAGVSGTTLSSDYIWRYNFSKANSTNFWSSPAQYGANGSSVPSGINTGTTYNVGNSLIDKAYITSGTDSNIQRYGLTTLRLSSYDDWYFNSIPSYPSTSMKRAIIFKMTDGSVWNLPSDMYTISGNSITWDMTHPTMVLLKGLECFAS